MIVDPTMPKIKPQKGFLRFDRLFNDAVRSNRLSAVVEVLLRIPLPGNKARRTARKILAEKGELPSDNR